MSDDKNLMKDGDGYVNEKVILERINRQLAEVIRLLEEQAAKSDR